MGGKLVYDAFISYSHAKDRPIAEALQSAVQKLGKPWYRRRALRVFRDDASLSATPHLWPSIEEALGHSRFLALLASPEAGSSPWVNKEVACWLAHRGADTVLIGLTDGALEWDAVDGDFRRAEPPPLPPALKGRFPAEPRWIDLRAYRDRASPRDRRFVELSANFAAAIHGVPKDDLFSQEVRQQRRTLRLALSAAFALLLLLAIVGWLWTVAIAQKNEMGAERDRAEHALGLATDTIFGIARSFRDTVVPAGVAEDVIPRLRKLQEQLSAGGEISPELRWREAMALIETAETLRVLGDTASALSAASQARDFMEGLVKSHPENPDYRRSLAIGYNKIGDVLKAEGDLAGAVGAYRQALTIWQALLLKTPGNTLWREDISLDDDDLGDALVAQRDLAGALAAYSDALPIRTGLALGQPGNVEWQRALAGSHEKVGDVLKAQGNLTAALAAYKKALAIRNELALKDPADAERQRDLAFSDDKIGDVLENQGDLAGALTAYQEGFATRTALVSRDPANSLWQNDLLLSYERIGGTQKALGDIDSAIAAFGHGTAIARALVQQDPSNLDWQINLAVALARMGTVRDPQQNCAEALVILKRLDAAGFLTSEQKHWIGEVEAELERAPAQKELTLTGSHTTRPTLRFRYGRSRLSDDDANKGSADA